MRIGLHALFLLFFISCSTFLFATTYTFTGSGDWANKGNWSDGLVPSGDLKKGDTILINGSAMTTDVCNDVSCTSDISGNFGVIIISKGASLTIRNPTQFSSGGTIIIYGTLVNKTIWEGYSTQNIIINGTFLNQFSFGNYGSVSINEGGMVQNEGGFGNYMDEYNGKGTITLNYGGTINNSNSFTPGFLINKGGTISNNGSASFSCDITGDFGTNAGQLSLGSSSMFAGTATLPFSISGDYTAASTAVHNFKIGGTTEDSYDALTVGGIASLDGTLNVSLVNGFVPTTNHDIPIIKGIITGKFSTVNIPTRYTLIYNTNSVVLRSIPLQPVSFKSFTAQLVNNSASLSWSVQNEQDALQYEVERSSDGTSYTKIGTVDAANAGQYGFTDPQPQTFNYYRIKCLHKDGFYPYSSTVALVLATTVNTFNGEGNWSDASKWSKGTVPYSLRAGERLVINGSCNFDLLEFTNTGEILIPVNSTLTLDYTTSNKTIFYNWATIIVQGTLQNKASYFENDHTIEVFGTFINSSFFQNYSPWLTIEEGGTFINTFGDTFSSGSIAVQGNATFINKGKIAGNTTFDGNLSNYGTLAPGNSPGTVQVNGDYTATPTAIHNFEVSGTASGSYDVLRATGAIHLDGTLNVSLINGYTAGKTDELPIMQGAIQGTFSKVNLPAGYTLIYTATSVLLKGEEALPIHFITFDAKKVAAGTLLSWTVSDEINVKGYVVERRVAQGQFQSIGFVSAEGKAQYRYTDAEPVQETVYYRIKNVDEDGAFSYSTTVMIENDTSGASLKAFPSPAHHSTITVLHKAAEPNSVLSLISIDGKIVKQVRPATGAWHTKISFSGLPSGLYFVQFDHGHGIVETIKVVN